MRALLLLALVATPALADAPAYDTKILPACLEHAASQSADGDSCIGEASTQCMAKPGGDTTVGMVDCLAAEGDQWDKLLNQWYSRALQQAEAGDADLKKLGSAADPAAPLLKQSQRDWISFRNASCAFQSARFQGGSGGGPAAATCLMELTGTQALRLRDLLEQEP